ncbi:unnamed protein product [Gordionus sp. m RMFG-2023]
MSTYFEISNIKKLKPIKSSLKKFQTLNKGPDWSYLDGRPTPLNGGQYRRKIAEIEMSKTIVKLNEEIENTLKMHNEQEMNISLERERIRNNKLKPKG